jgi:hypothetical protein
MSLIMMMGSSFQRSAFMARLDGNDGFLRNGGFTGASNNKTATLHVIIDRNTMNMAVNRPVLLHGSTFSVYLNRVTATYLQVEVQGFNASGAIILHATSANYNWGGGDPLRLHVCIDMANTSNRFIKIDDMTLSVEWSIYTNQALNHAGTGTVRPFFVSGVGLVGDVYNLWYANQYEPDSTKFFVGGKAADFGSDGSLVTGTPPLIFINGFEHLENRGTGGAFTTVGTITQGADAPI